MGRTVLFGSIGGIAGGILFGIIMQTTGQLEMLSAMMGFSGLLAGWIIHLMISIVFGAGFGLLALRFSSLVSLTVLYSVLIWVIGPLVMMPLLMGQGTALLQAFAPAQLMGLATHFFYTAVVAVVYTLLVKAAHRTKVKTTAALK